MRNGSSGPEPPTRAPTEVALPHLPTEIVRHGPGLPDTQTAGQPPIPDGSTGPTGAAHEDARQAGERADVIRYGPGVPATGPSAQVGLTAEHVWRAGQPGEPSRRQRRLGRIFGLALTVVLLAASGVVLYLRFHHAPFHVTGVAITQRVSNGCGVDVTGKITTNGAQGTVSYQWLIVPSKQPPQVLSESANAGQQAVYVSMAVEGAGLGSASQTVILQVLGPDTRTASATVTVSCQ